MWVLLSLVQRWVDVMRRNECICRAHFSSSSILLCDIFHLFLFWGSRGLFDQILFRLFPQLLFYLFSWFFLFQQWYLVYPQIRCVVEWLMAVKFHGIRHIWFLLKSVSNLWVRIGGLPLANNDFELNHCMADQVTGHWSVSLTFG